MGIDKNANSIEQLKQFVANFVNKRSELVQGGCPVLNTAVDSDDGNPLLRDHVRKALGQWTKRIRDIVNTGILKAEIRKSVDPDATATVIVSMLEGALMMARLQHSDLALKQVREYLVGFLESLA
jgi:TetR/AcrR family transcriptional repressor of nem operon